MAYAPQIIFIIIFGVTVFYVTKRIREIRKNILLGREVELTGSRSERFKTMVLFALGQKKMFHKPLPAILHLFVYIGFIVINIEMIEIILDGFFGTHRVFATGLGNVYPFFINVFELLAVSVIIGCVIFLIRRNILGLRRFKGEEMRRWPTLDANLILTAEILLMLAFLTMNSTDVVLQQRGAEHYVQTGSFFFSGLLVDFFTNFSNATLIAIERFAWWFHIIGIFAFSMYIFYDSKHLHIFFAFPNTWYSKLTPTGKFSNMPEVTKEVKLMLGVPEEAPAESTEEAPPGRFGAKDVQDLTWKNILDAYSCTECGRCTASCPANMTGKKLSPRKIMMDTRDRAEEIGRNIKTKGTDKANEGAALLDGYITSEELMACTTCQACVEACPVNIDPLDIIMQLRRYKAMEESSTPAAWNAMFSNVETNFAPWKFAPSDRFKWAEKIKNN
ncbi:(Fe-S)-binding protein [Cytophagaceae bacterium ABcell3]|nr:(Fe-S)-binding protein [Cytophagaceae bacterium ABcell3]